MTFNLEFSHFLNLKKKLFPILVNVLAFGQISTCIFIYSKIVFITFLKYQSETKIKLDQTFLIQSTMPHIMMTIKCKTILVLETEFLLQQYRQISSRDSKNNTELDQQNFHRCSNKNITTRQSTPLFSLSLFKLLIIIIFLVTGAYFLLHISSTMCEWAELIL